MTTQSLENIISLTAHVSRQSPEYAVKTISTNLLKLYRLAKTLHKRYENACNYQWACTDTYERQTSGHELKASTLGREIGLKIEHQRDPRGCALKVNINGSEWGIW